MTPEQKELIELYYEVHPDGTVISKVGQNAGRVLKMYPGHKTERGYPCYSLCLSRFPLPRRYCNVRVHTLLANFFIPNPDNKPFVNHKNGNKEDFRLENLEWVTSQENHHHAIRTGLTDQLGEANSQAKLTEGQVHEICASYRPGMAHKDWQAMNKGRTSPSNLTNIFNGRRWVHISSLYGIVPKVSRVSVIDKPSRVDNAHE